MPNTPQGDPSHYIRQDLDPTGDDDQTSQGHADSLDHQAESPGLMGWDVQDFGEDIELSSTKMSRQIKISIFVERLW